MTLKQARNLTLIQSRKVTPASMKLILRKKPKTALLREIILNSTDEKVLGAVISHFVECAKSGDVKAKLFLNRLASERFNKNPASRSTVLKRIWALAIVGDSFGLRGLLVGVRDFEGVNRSWALGGLRELAKKGDARVLPGLIFGMKDADKENRSRALEGLNALAEKGNVKAKKALKELGK